MGPITRTQKPPFGVPLISSLFLEPFARLAVWCALSSYSSHKGQASSRQKKRHREDIEVGDFSFSCSRPADVPEPPLAGRRPPGEGRQAGRPPAQEAWWPRICSGEHERLALGLLEGCRRPPWRR